MKLTVIPIVIHALSTVTKGLVKELEDLYNKRTSRDDPNYSIVEIGQNTEKTPGDLRRVLVTQTQTPMKDHQITLRRKIHNEK